MFFDGEVERILGEETVSWLEGGKGGIGKRVTMPLTGPRMGYKVPGRNAGGVFLMPQGRGKLVDSGIKTLLDFSCGARRLAWS